MTKKLKATKLALLAGTTTLAVYAPQAHAQFTSDALINKLEQKGILSADEAKALRAEAAESATNFVNQIPASKWRLADSIKSIGLYGDLRLRYEYRGVDNAPGLSPDTYYRERMRYALRIGLKGDLFDDFSYGVRVDTSNNPRSAWDTFGNNTSAGSVTPSDKNSSGLFVGQVYLNWHPESWMEITAGRMPNPLYTTSMVWDGDINPEGAFEKFKYTTGVVDWFAGLGQFDYQNPTSARVSPSGDTFLLAWQLGANVRIGKDMSFKIAPVLYNYLGSGSSGGLNSIFVGQGSGGMNVGIPGGNTAFSQEGINDLLVLEIPAEFDFKINHTRLGDLQAKVFGDFAYNIDGSDRARNAYLANPAAFPGMSGPVSGEDIAYQVGFSIGTAGSVARKHFWEARVYWQHVEQYALDVNLIDSDFFEGRGNLEGVCAAFSYNITDAIIGTVRYGFANRINDQLDTGGSNLDIPGLNPIKNYNLVQMDLTWKF